jgi:ferredoxin-nitrite reductase
MTLSLDQQGGLDPIPPPTSPTCPGLFHPNVAPDGHLARIRIPGGLLKRQQCLALANLLESQGESDRYLEVTNRANVQIRGLPGPIPDVDLAQLQQVGLAAHPAVDHLRNILASPTAGIDSAQLIDTRPMVQALNHYLSNHLELASLSPKFSIGLDGGEQVSIRQQPNDLLLSAVQGNGVWFHLRVAGAERTWGNFLIQPDQCVAAVAAIAQVYLDTVDPNLARKPRLKQVFATNQLDRIQQYLSFPLVSTSPDPPDASPPRPPLGIHPQLQSDLAYLGVALPLGRLTVNQLRQLAELVDRRGLRLTPWRTLVLSDLHWGDLPQVERALADLGLRSSRNQLWAGLIACSGKGCAASATDTQADVLALVQALEAQDLIKPSVTIHFTGCPKSCAHHGQSDITLVGTLVEQQGQLKPAYGLYMGAQELPFGRRLTTVETAELPQILTQILTTYNHQRQPDQSFQMFVDHYIAQYSVAQLLGKRQDQGPARYQVEVAQC